MPQLIVAFAVGAGLYAVTRLLAKTLEAQNAAQRQRAEATARGKASAAQGPKNLGALEWDETSGVYKPKTPSTH